MSRYSFELVDCCQSCSEIMPSNLLFLDVGVDEQEPDEREEAHQRPTDESLLHLQQQASVVPNSLKFH